MWEDELNLIQHTYTEDEIGNQIPEDIKVPIFCRRKSVSQTEFYNASANGLKPTIVFIVNSYEYNGETEVEFEKIKYNVIRTYSASSEKIELICEKVLGNG